MTPCISLVDGSVVIVMALIGVIVFALKSLPSVKPTDKEQDSRPPKVHRVKRTTEKTTWWE